MPSKPPELYYIACKDGLIVALGERQTEFLREQGHAHRVAAFKWIAPNHTSDEIHAIVMSFSELRECDFCGASPSGWKIPCTRFMVTVGPGIEGPVGGPLRPIFACSECIRFVRNNDPRRLIEHAINARIDQVRAMGYHKRTSKQLLAAAARPQVKRMVDGVFQNLLGQPEED